MRRILLRTQGPTGRDVRCGSVPLSENIRRSIELGQRVNTVQTPSPARLLIKNARGGPEKSLPDRGRTRPTTYRGQR